jgi:bifunctional non-homologous end joining protein LigD
MVGSGRGSRFTLIVEALGRLRSRSCIIDGEAVCCGDDGVSSFDRIRYRRHDASVFLYAFDPIELNGDDLRRDPLEVRKATLISVIAKTGAGIRFNEHLERDDGQIGLQAGACRAWVKGSRGGGPTNSVNFRGAIDSDSIETSEPGLIGTEGCYRR